MGFERHQPYNDLPRLWPVNRELDSRAVLRVVAPARAALAELKATCHQLPNVEVLLQTLGLEETRYSAAIENIVTTQDALYQGLADDERSANKPTREVLAHQRALKHGLEHVRTKRPITVPLMEEMVSLITGNRAGVRRVPGTHLMGAGQEPIYTPPEGEMLLRDLLSDLSEFMYRADEIDPLVRMAVGHYQFEAIHPFADGNGRTGRLINLLYLVDQGLLDVPVLYLSGYILENRQLYYAGLRAVTEDKEWEPWIILIVEGIRRAAVATLVKVESIIKAMIETEQLIRDKSRGMYSKELVNCVYALPYCKVQFLIDADIAGRQTASKYLQQLVTIGVLREQKIGRDKYFINPRLLEITMGANFQYKQRN